MTNSLNVVGLLLLLLLLLLLMFLNGPPVNTVQFQPKHTCTSPEKKTDTGLLTHEWDALSNTHKNAN